MSATTKPKLTVTQLRMLLEAIEEDPNLYNIRDSGRIEYLTVQKWMDLAAKLNNSLNGAQIPVSSWKYVLRYWSMKAKSRKAGNQKSKLPPEGAPKLTKDEQVELKALEDRLKTFIEREQSKGILGITYSGSLDPLDITDSNAAEGVRFVLNMLETFSADEEENTPSTSQGNLKRRCTLSKEEDPNDPTGRTKILKIVFDKVPDYTEEEKQKIQSENEKYRQFSEGLAENIAMIQSRIQTIKDLWKHRCGDN